MKSAFVHSRCLLAAAAITLAQFAAPVALGQPAGPAQAQRGVTGEDEYVVRPGETLNAISARLLHEGETRGVQRAFAQHNRLSNPDSIRPGQVLRVPRAWLKSQPAALEVAAVQGEVRSGGRALAAGSKLAAGSDLRTGKDGYATLKLADGSTLMLMPSADARVERAQLSPATGATDTALRLENGRAEAAVPPAKKGATRFEIRTPVAVTAVRGTRFRVAAQGDRSAAASEVMEGALGVRDAADRGSVNVAAGFGTRVAAGEAPLAPRRLLPAPFLWEGVRLLERAQTSLEFNPLQGAQSYRTFLSPRADFTAVIAEGVGTAPAIGLPRLGDGDYFVRVRGIDGIGLEGFDRVARLRLRLRAEPPRPTQPPARSRIHGDAAEFAWSAEPGAAGYVLEIARDAAFRALAGRWADLREPRHTATGLAPGEYHWRVASAAADGRLSLYSEPSLLSVRLGPPQMNPPKLEDETIALSWSAQPGRRFEVQMAADADFSRIVTEQRTAEPGAALPRPAPGTYHLRLRAVDADGTAGPYTAARALEVPAKAPNPACLIEGPAGACAVFAPPPTAPR